MDVLDEMGKLDDSSYFKSLKKKVNGDIGKIMAYEAYHNKFNLNGSGEKDFKDGAGLEDGNQRLHLTMAYNKVYNIVQRFPLLRQGTMHYINCYVDNSSHKAIANEMGESYNATGASARDGASVGMDTCLFKEMPNVIHTEEINTVNTANINPHWNISFAGAENHALAVNSKTIVGNQEYTGSSWDKNGENLFIGDKNYVWNNNKKSIGNFYWFSHIKDVEKYTREKIKEEREDLDEKQSNKKRKK